MMISNRLPVLALKLGAAATIIIGAAAAVAAFAPRSSSPCSTASSTWTSTSFRNNEQNQQQFGIANIHNNYDYNGRCIGHCGSSNRRSTELFSFMGSDGGILGIGTPELVRVSNVKKQLCDVHGRPLFAFVLGWV